MKLGLQGLIADQQAFDIVKPKVPKWLRRKSITRQLLMGCGFVIALMLVIALTLALRAGTSRKEIQDLRHRLDTLEQSEAATTAIDRFKMVSIDLLDPNVSEEQRVLLRHQLRGAVNSTRHLGGANFEVVGTSAEQAEWRNLMTRMEGVEKALVAVVPQSSAVQRLSLRQLVDSYNREMNHSVGSLKGRASEMRMDAANKIRADVRFTFLWAIFLCLLAAITLTGLLIIVARNVYRPTRSLFDAVERMARGHMDATLVRGDFLEFIELSASLRRLRKVVIRDRNAGSVDAMSGLPNRTALVARFRSLEAQPRSCFALIDIDRFKQVNDDFGHAAGDALIRKVGERLLAVLPEGSMVARIGGDEIGAYFPLPHAEIGKIVADRMVREMRIPFDLDVANVSASVSVGVTDINSREGSDRMEEIIKEADLALYVAKNAGRNQAAAYEPSMSVDHAVRRSLENDLIQAIEREDLRLAYQPIRSLNDDEREVEALVRWKHSQHGDVAASLLIDVAERSGQMAKLGEWIIDRALTDLSLWPDLSVSINLSVVQLKSDGLAVAILERCRALRILPQRVIFEVTETIALEHNDRALVTLGLLRGFGFRVALDDFGAGYSSLWLLKSFDFDRLKLDKSLISDLSENAASRAVFETAVMLGRRLGLDVVAEGVSDASEMELLRKAGCTHLQGYFLSRPLEREAVEAYYFGKAKQTGPRRALSVEVQPTSPNIREVRTQKKRAA